MDFGNCDPGLVEVLLNGELIATAFYAPPSSLSKIVEFDFEDGDVLLLREAGSIVMFNSFHIINCGINPNYMTKTPVNQKAPEYGIMLGKLVPLPPQ